MDSVESSEEDVTSDEESEEEDSSDEVSELPSDSLLSIVEDAAS